MRNITETACVLLVIMLNITWLKRAKKTIYPHLTLAKIQRKPYNWLI